MPEFKPMKHSRNVYKSFSTIINNACKKDGEPINAQQLSELEVAIEQGRKVQQTKRVDPVQAQQMLLAFSSGRSDSLVSVAKFKYSDKNYNAQAAKFDFSCYLFKKLSANKYNRLITQILTIDSGRIDNTFLRNNALVKYMLIVQMHHDKSEGQLGQYTLTHLEWIQKQVPSTKNLLEIINFSLINALNNLSENYENCYGMIKLDEWSEKELAQLELPLLEEVSFKSSRGVIRLKHKTTPLSTLFEMPKQRQAGSSSQSQRLSFKN